MLERPYEEQARKLGDALRRMREDPDGLDMIEDLECYLSYHFGAWLEKYAATPDDMAEEFDRFAVPPLPFC